MNLVCVRYFYAPIFDNVEKVFSGLAQKFLVGHFFGIVMPIPHFNSMVSAVGDYGFALEGRMGLQELLLSHKVSLPEGHWFLRLREAWSTIWLLPSTWSG